MLAVLFRNRLVCNNDKVVFCCFFFKWESQPAAACLNQIKSPADDFSFFSLKVCPLFMSEMEKEKETNKLVFQALETLAVLP